MTRRKHLAEREPSGRVKREAGPDRGTERVQEMREDIAGDRRRPIDLSDPVDVLYRGRIRHLTDRQAAAANAWRANRSLVQAGGPVLAQMREPGGGSEISELKHREALDALNAIDQGLNACSASVRQETRAVVIDRAKCQRLGDLRRGLDAVAKAVGIR